MLFNIINDCFNPDDTLINETLSSYCLFVGLVFLMIEFPTFQENSDFLLCRGDVEGKIFSPWLQSLEMEGLKFVPNKVPSSLTIDTDSGCISAIVCGDEIYKADAFVSAMGLSSLQSIVKNR